MEIPVSNHRDFLFLDGELSLLVGSFINFIAPYETHIYA
jgi:hypothetical protein